MLRICASVLSAAICAAPWAAEAGTPDGRERLASLMYIPPGLESSVVLYHSFESGVKSPEVNAIGAGVESPKEIVGDGLNGKGMAIRNRDEASKEFLLRSEELSPHRNLTISMWWRIDEPLELASCYHLLALRGKGYVSSFVRGKGEWCALERPTFVYQCYDFPDIGNNNDPWTGEAWVKPGEWHHIAMSVSLGSEVCVYWDGKLRVRHSLKGRSFRPDDGVNAAGFGPTWLFHPMTIDDVLVCNRALSGDEIHDYVEAVRHLLEVDFPFSDGLDTERAGRGDSARNIQ